MLASFTRQLWCPISFSDPQFSHLWNGANKSRIIWLLRRSQGDTSANLTAPVDLSSRNQCMYTTRLCSKQAIFFFQFWLESISLSVFLFFLFLISLIKGTVNWKGKTCQNAENSENTSFQIVQLGAGKMTRAPYNPVQTENWKITQLACAIYVCYVPSAKQLLLNKWQTR